MKVSVIFILNVLYFAMTMQFTLTSRGNGNVPNRKSSVQNSLMLTNGLKRTQRGFQDSITTQEYYADLLKKLQAYKATNSVSTDSLSVEESVAVNKYISKLLTSQKPGDASLHSAPSIIDILRSQQLLPNFNSPPVEVPSFAATIIPDPNEYAKVPYIPAIHGTQSPLFQVNDNSLLSLLSSSSYPESASNATVQTDNRVTSTTTAATITSLQASLASCRANTLCSMALAGVVTAATVGAVAFPVLVAGPLLSNRKKRNSENFHQENIIDILNQYHAKRQIPFMAGLPVSPNRSDLFKRMASNVSEVSLKNTQTEKALNKTNENIENLERESTSVESLVSKKENQLLNNITYGADNEKVSSRNTVDEHLTLNQHGKLPNSINSISFSDENKKLGVESGQTNRGFIISSNFSLEHRIPSTQIERQISKDQLSQRLSSDLLNFITQFDQLNQVLNISSLYESKSNKSSVNQGIVNNEQQSFVRILDAYLKNDSSKMTAANVKPNPIFDSTHPLQPLPDPFKTISTTQLYQNFILNKHEHKDSNSMPTSKPLVLTPSTIATLSNTPNELGKIPQDLLELLSKYIQNKASEPILGNEGQFNLLPEIPAQNQYEDMNPASSKKPLTLTHEEKTNIAMKPQASISSTIPDKGGKIPYDLGDTQQNLLKLLSDYVRDKQIQPVPGQTESINPLSQGQLPEISNTVKLGYRPSFSTAQAIHPAVTTPSQNIIPVNTINNILQNPPGSTQNLNFILAKLPALINEKNNQLRPAQNEQAYQNPSAPNSNQISQFTPTIIHHYQPASGYQPGSTTVQLRPSSGSSVIAPVQTHSGKLQELSPEIVKFYGLLCKAILEPHVPLNRVTAYIAEKCLVMRFTGILKV